MCDFCNGFGYILAATERGLEIQKCDTCDRFKDDNEATEACYKDAIKQPVQQ